MEGTSYQSQRYFFLHSTSTPPERFDMSSIGRAIQDVTGASVHGSQHSLSRPYTKASVLRPCFDPDPDMSRKTLSQTRGDYSVSAKGP